jgi:hypothetical protein
MTLAINRRDVGFQQVELSTWAWVARFARAIRKQYARLLAVQHLDSQPPRACDFKTTRKLPIFPSVVSSSRGSIGVQPRADGAGKADINVKSA